MKESRTSVLIVGGSLVGLSAAVFLARHGVTTVLVEKHPRSSAHPRAMGFTTRTMELYRAVGLSPKIPQVPPGFGRPRRVTVESLAGRWAAEEVAWTPTERELDKGKSPRNEGDYSLCTGAAIAQDRLEPILREKAIESGADIRMSTTLVSFEQNDAGVTALLRSSDGLEYSLAADYLIAADGASSPIRESLQIGRDGRGNLRTVRSVLFRAPLDRYLESGVSQFEIQQPGFTAMLTTYRDGRWLLIFSDDQERDEPTLKAMVEKALGRSDLPIEIVTTGRWELTALIADRFSSGRVFLAGDSAHTLPPARGGYGANTGIEDVHNLAWKIASVLSGASQPELLDTYDAERRPVAWLRHGQIFARPDYGQFARPADKQVPIIDDIAMELGQLYRSAAVIGAGEDLPPALPPDQWVGQPGTRAPHVWVSRQGVRLSTLDLFQPDWVLITQDERWLPAAAAASESLKIKVNCVVVANAAEAGLLEGGPLPDVPTAPAAAMEAGSGSPHAFRKAFGIGASGASLVRPDGYVAWRSLELPDNATAALTDAARRAAFSRSPERA